ncbi:hypothetical protein KI387_006196, partial [Taxus chinensis]
MPPKRKQTASKKTTKKPSLGNEGSGIANPEEGEHPRHSDEEEKQEESDDPEPPRHEDEEEDDHDEDEEGEEYNKRASGKTMPKSSVTKEEEKKKGRGRPKKEAAMGMQSKIEEHIAGGSSKMTKKKKGKKRSADSYKIYIYKVLKQVHPEIGISSRAMGIMNSFMNDIFERLAFESAKLSQYNKRNTITSREIQSAARLALPGELAKHAISE